jgi:hypothetical protein
MPTIDNVENNLEYFRVLNLKLQRSKVLEVLPALKKFEVRTPWTVPRGYWKIVAETQPRIVEAQIAFDKVVEAIAEKLRAKFYSELA